LAFAGGGAFSKRADARILIVAPAELAESSLMRSAHLVFSNRARECAGRTPIHALRDFDRIIQQQLGAQMPRLRQFTPAVIHESLALPIAA
jgi:hypothetical protein